MEFVKQLVLSLVSGGFLLGLLVLFKEVIFHKRDRKEKKADKLEEKNDLTKENTEDIVELQKTMSEFIKKNDAMAEGIKLLLLQSILDQGNKFVGEKEISFDDRQRFHKMHRAYHVGLNGNGDADLIVEAVDKLPLKKN